MFADVHFDGVEDAGEGCVIRVTKGRFKQETGSTRFSEDMAVQCLIDLEVYAETLPVAVVCPE